MQPRSELFANIYYVLEVIKTNTYERISPTLDNVLYNNVHIKSVIIGATQ